MEIEVATIAGIPVYDYDVEVQGIPAAVEALKKRVAAADALLIATPEYNNSIPGPLKNALDWLSRPPKDIDRVFGGKPTGLIGASAGGKGTVLSQVAWLPVLRQLHLRYFPDKQVYVGPSGQMFDDLLHYPP
jgi:NAD(P)H-dependent FMN reductase